MLNARTLINLSKQIEKIIYNSTRKDTFGYILLDNLLEELNRHPAWEHIALSDIAEVVKGSSIKRLEISGNKIRLIRRDTPIPTALSHRVIPPKSLYYGTSAVGLSRIKTFGIKAFRSDYVKLFPDKRMIQVLTHKNSHVSYIEVDAFRAYQDGIPFIKGELNCYMTEYIPAKYIKKII